MLGERYAAGDAACPTRPTRTCTARSSGCCSSEVGADLGGRLRAGRSRNDQVATLFQVYLRDHARGRSPAWCSTSSTRSPTRPAATSTSSCPAAPTSSTPSRCCSSHHLLAHAWPLLRDVDRLRDWDARVAADSPYGSGALAGSSLGLDPEAVAAELGFTGSSAELDRRHRRARLRRRVRLRHRA